MFHANFRQLMPNSRFTTCDGNRYRRLARAADRAVPIELGRFLAVIDSVSEVPFRQADTARLDVAVAGRHLHAATRSRTELSATCEPCPEAAWRADPDAGVDRRLGKVLVLRYEDVGVSGDRFGPDSDVVGVAHLGFEAVGCHGHDRGFAPEEGNNFTGDIPGQTDLPRQHPLQLAEYRLAGDEAMPGKSDGERVSTDAAGGEGTDEDAGVSRRTLRKYPGRCLRPSGIPQPRRRA